MAKKKGWKNDPDRPKRIKAVADNVAKICDSHKRYYSKRAQDFGL